MFLLFTRPVQEQIKRFIYGHGPFSVENNGNGWG